MECARNSTCVSSTQCHPRNSVCWSASTLDQCADLTSCRCGVAPSTFEAHAWQRAGEAAVCMASGCRRAGPAGSMHVWSIMHAFLLPVRAHGVNRGGTYVVRQLWARTTFLACHSLAQQWPAQPLMVLMVVCMCICALCSPRSWNQAEGECQTAHDHPCLQTKDAIACATAVDALGNKLCSVSSWCESKCTMCAQCVPAALEYVVQPFADAQAANPANTSAAAALTAEMCKMAGTDARLSAACTRLVADMALPGGHLLATRPAAICIRLGMCDASCKLPGTASPDGPAVHPLDVCSPTGSRDVATSSAPVTTFTVPAGMCRSKADCAAMQQCDLSTSVTSVCSCDPYTGLNTT